MEMFKDVAVCPLNHSLTAKYVELPPLDTSNLEAEIDDLTNQLRAKYKELYDIQTEFLRQHLNPNEYQNGDVVVNSSIGVYALCIADGDKKHFDILGSRPTIYLDDPLDPETEAKYLDYYRNQDFA